MDKRLILMSAFHPFLPQAGGGGFRPKPAASDLVAAFDPKQTAELPVSWPRSRFILGVAILVFGIPPEKVRSGIRARGPFP